MTPLGAVEAFSSWTCPWWLAGGWAIDLLIGHETRSHRDLDILILRRDRVRVREWLREWDVHAADSPGVLRPWPTGETLPPAVHDIWCRRASDSPWAFQLMTDDAEDGDWLFRRDRRIRRPIDSLAGRASRDGLAVLTPEVQLLYKSRGLRAKDLADFDAVLPHLTDDEHTWLRTSLELALPDHPWIVRLT